jgi:hypothetical protein
MVWRVGCLAFVVSLIPAGLQAQEPPSTTLFATIGRHEPSNPVHRAIDRVHDKLDRCPCCAYGKSHNDIGVQSFRGTKTFILGSACEFFTVPCRTPPPEASGSKWWRKSAAHGGADCGCR